MGAWVVAAKRTDIESKVSKDNATGSEKRQGTIDCCPEQSTV